MNEKWTLIEDLAVCILYTETDPSVKKLLRQRIMQIYNRSSGSVDNKEGNIQYVATGGKKGRSNKSHVDVEAWSLFSKLSQAQITYHKQAILDDDMSHDPFLDKQIELEPGEDIPAMYKRRSEARELRAVTLRLSGFRCQVTGIRELGILETCHVKQRSLCTKQQKSDVHNTMVLSAFYHTLYDNFLMTIDSNMSIHYSPKLRITMDKEEYDRFIEPYKILNVNDKNRPATEYLEWHNRIFEERNGLKLS